MAPIALLAKWPPIPLVPASFSWPLRHIQSMFSGRDLQAGNCISIIGICTGIMTGKGRIHCYLRGLDETECLGRGLGRLALPGDVICLDGDLGAGKTTFTQQIAHGLDVPAECYVTSPSFAIMHEYPGGRLTMYHMDFYRLQGSDEVIDLGFDEYFYLDGLTVVEWARLAGPLLPETRLQMALRITEDGSRELICRCFGEGWHDRLSQALTDCGLDWRQEPGV